MRNRTIKNLYDKKFDCFPFDGVWRATMGEPETNGAWLVYGAEKNGKTWFSLHLAEYLSSFASVLYISAEEGMGKTFVDACQRAQIEPTNRRLHFLEYIPVDELSAKLAKRKSAKVIIIDNCTVYADELKATALRKLLQKHPDKLFVFVAHEERNEPYTAAAKMAKKLAKIIVRVEGLACFVSGRCNGGTLTINEAKATLYHGDQISETP